MEAIKIDWRNEPIPLVENSASALDYHEIEIDLGNPASSEPLVDADEYGLATANYYGRNDGLNAPYYRAFEKALAKIWLRKSVALRLRSVNEVLAPYGAELCLLDCYRPVALQKEVWDHFCARAKETLDNPDESEVVNYAGHYCSDPRGFDENNFKTWPVHSTGGDCDLLLRARSNKEHLFFGSIFDDASEISYTDHFERLGPKSSSEIEACRNRRLLYWAMTACGFVNYPYEWWHFDLGTQMWVMNSGDPERKAYYGYMKSPE